MKHTTIRIFCLALCASLALSGCSKTGGEGGSQTADGNSAVTTAEQAEETGETSVSETEVSDVTEKNETTTVSGTDVSDDAKVSGTVTGTVKVSETAKTAETTRVPGPPDVTAAPVSPPPEGNKPDTYADQSEYGYSDTELCDLALRYYGSRTNYKPDHAEVDSTDGNTVNIHLYDDGETHTSTVNWYYVDRNTGKGTDISGNEVDLTAPAAELWNPSVPQRGQTETGKWCSVLFIGYINTDIESFIS
ncbi:MAG: hypothetical protein J5864_07865, partial [Oscillospiraceae bacterium]|nr:hypothetical protein [Oscillospiraceae bacterium]